MAFLEVRSRFDDQLNTFDVKASECLSAHIGDGSGVLCSSQSCHGDLGAGMCF